ALPQQQQRREPLLILLADKGSAEFQRGSEAIEERVAVGKQCRGVESSTAPCDVCTGDPVCAGYFAPPHVPNKPVEVVGIELIEIERLTCALAGGAERDLAQSPEFPDHVWDFDRAGDVDREIASTCEEGSCGESGNFRGEFTGIDGRG